MADEKGTAIVTGASGALGAAVLGRLIGRGYHVVAPLIESEIPTHLQGLDTADFVTGVDLTDDAAVSAYFCGLESADIAINIAGGFLFKPIAETSAEDVLTQFRMNALSCFLACREEIALMGKGDGGAIVNVAARPALRPELGASMTAYTMAKAGVAALTEALAAEAKDLGVRVNAVAPSIIDTPANREAMPDADPSGWVSPQAIARLAQGLAENEAINGAVVPIYGDV